MIKYFEILRNGLCRISQYCAIMQIYTLEQEKRGLCPYDDKRYLLADLADGSPNPNTHAYGHRELVAEEQVEMDMPDQPGADLIIEQQQPRRQANTTQSERQELNFKGKHARVVKTLSKRGHRDSDGEEIGGDEYEQVPNGDENGEITDAQLLQAERAAAARPGAATRIGDVIERICARGNLQVPTSPPRRYPVLSPQRAGKIKL